ncbi:MAG: serine/threonine protein kinase [Ardenticatenaceae bacterium]|nr:serine/threonine protein kinase [Ardenticatenaceae bacterium]
MHIGRYEIQDELGQGGMAAVYLGYDPAIKRHVAVKVMSFELTNDDIYRDYFFREAEAVATLEHAAIVPIYDFGLHGDQPYIVMRHMPGGTLRDRLNADELSSQQFAQILARVAQGLDYAHQHNIVHRDLKPANVLFDDAGQAYLADFGLAKFVNRPTGQTQGLLVGTPAYMSPEQAKGVPLDGRADIYALGCILYEALTGAIPYPDRGPFDMALAHVKEPIPDLRHERPDLQPGWAEIIGKAMAKAPQDRYATAVSFAQEVNDMIAGRWYLRKLDFTFA